MAGGIEILSILATTLFGLGFAETLAHRRRLSSIKTRIHVSGTRGKSSVTRLIAAGMRPRVRTAAKTTGTLARMILPDGREVPVFRPSGANIIEQKRIVAAALELNVEALVLECMALQPELHWLAESRLVRGTHAVITNARADHLDVMGPTVADVAKCLAGMIPMYGGKLFTAERDHLHIFEAACQDRKCELIPVTEDDILAVTPAEMSRFTYLEHAENVATALKVTADLGISREDALGGMWGASPDPGALTTHALHFFGRTINFVNGFAANDPQSTEKVWRLATARFPDVERRLAVFNLRADRASRTLQFAQDTDFWLEADAVVLLGSGAYQFSRMAAKANRDTSRFVHADYDRAEECFESILEMCAERTLVVGMGNIGGVGLGLVRFFKNRSLPTKEPG